MKLNKKDWMRIRDDDNSALYQELVLPYAMRHTFGQDLFCKWCGISIITHWKMKIVCKRAPLNNKEKAKIASEQEAEKVNRRGNDSAKFECDPRIDYSVKLNKRRKRNG